MAQKRRERRAGGVTTRFFDGGIPQSVTPRALPTAKLNASSTGHMLSSATLNPDAPLTKSFANNGFMSLEPQKAGRSCDVTPLSAWVDSLGPRTTGPWDVSRADTSIAVSDRAVSRTKGLARFIKSTLGSTTASMQSLGSMHSMMASTRPVKSPSRWAAGEASSRFNLPAYQSAANIRTGRSVASLASNTYPAPPVRDHGRAFTGGPVNAASQRALRVAYDSAPPLEPSQTALQHRLRGGFAHNNIGTLTTGVGELEARRDFRAAGQAGVLPRLTDTDVTEIPYLRRGSPPEPSQGPRTTKFHPRMPPAAPAFETVFLRTPQAARPARGDIQKQREEGHGAGVGFMGFNGDMNMRSSINYADKGTALYAEPSYTFHGEKPFGRSPADPSTLPAAMDRAAMASTLGNTVARRTMLINRYEEVAQSEAEKQLCYAQVNMINHRAATEAHAERVAARHDHSRDFHANTDPDVRFHSKGFGYGRAGANVPRSLSTLRAPFGHD